jgi:hypothetical protein
LVREGRGMKNLNKLSFYSMAVLALLLSPLFASAAVSGIVYGADNYSNAGCGASSGDCGTLTVNESNGMVQIALMLPESMKAPSDEKQKALNSRLLKKDFLQGMDEGPVFEKGAAGNATGGDEPDWVVAASRSLDYSSGPGAISGSVDDSGESLRDYLNIYEWKVDADIFDAGVSIDQIAISDIHVAPAREYSNERPLFLEYTNERPGFVCDPNVSEYCAPQPCLPGDPACSEQIPPDVNVPLPGTLVLMLFGLGILGGRKIAVRKSRQLAPLMVSDDQRNL